MKICRASSGTEEFYGILENDEVRRLEGEPFEKLTPANVVYKKEDVRLLAPATPSKIICLGKNYYDHAKETGGEPPETPLIFLKPPSSIISPEDGIITPQDCKRLDYEAELAIVIKKRCKDVSMENYKDVIFGYTCLNDVTARDIQSSDGQWIRAKGFDTFCPFGPWIETKLDPNDLLVECRLNGKTRQSARTSILIHPIDKLIWFISRVMTLLPGDIIATGTPAGIGPMQLGDTVEIEVEGIGVLRNHIVK
ncbi:MAG: fumarylacetoacetate hydrolase family protein [Clostridiales bacterium]|jgi:2-keto-4-pentenoate hydratase/2-oxohepta-3-ene-1,7-dioic acid hydratase in catechol pathway|nr:fumarylacetoacetate hydrolase family protein [Clostridiales bacterium]